MAVRDEVSYPCNDSQCERIGTHGSWCFYYPANLAKRALKDLPTRESFFDFLAALGEQAGKVTWRK